MFQQRKVHNPEPVLLDQLGMHNLNLVSVMLDLQMCLVKYLVRRTGRPQV